VRTSVRSSRAAKILGEVSHLADASLASLIEPVHELARAKVAAELKHERLERCALKSQEIHLSEA